MRGAAADFVSAETSTDAGAKSRRRAVSLIWQPALMPEARLRSRRTLRAAAGGANVRA